MRKLALCLTIGAALAANTAAANPAATPAANPAADTAASLEIARKALQGFDTEIEKIRTDWKIQGLSVVITKGDQIIYSKGHGMRDPCADSPVRCNQIGWNTQHLCFRFIGVGDKSTIKPCTGA